MNTLGSGKFAQRKRLYKYISCVTFDADSSEYEMHGLNYFDVSLETYSKGCLTGTRLAAEFLMEAAQDDSFDGLLPVLEEASKVLAGNGSGPEVESKRGAAAGLLDTLQQVFNTAASRLDFTEVFQRKLDYYESDLTEQIESMRQTNAAILAGLSRNATQQPKNTAPT